MYKLYGVCTLCKEPPSGVHITESAECTFGVECNVTCSIRGGRPSPVIRWRIDDEDLVPIKTLLPPAATSSSVDNPLSAQNRPPLDEHVHSINKPLLGSSLSHQTSSRRRFLVPVSLKQWQPNYRHLDNVIIEMIEISADNNLFERCDLREIL